MIFVPLPFVVGFLLVILLLRMASHGDGVPANGLFLALVGVYALLSMLIGLRWGYGITAFLTLQTVLAAAWPPLAWTSFSSLTTEGDGRLPSAAWLHLLPVALVAALAVLWPEPIDFVIIAIYLAYGIALARLAWSGPDALRLARLDEASLAHRALATTAAALILFAAIDILVSVDIRGYGAVHAATIVGLANVPALLVLGIAATVAGRNRSPRASEDEQAAPSIVAEEDIAVVDNLNALMQGKGLFRDQDLNLNRLARKSGIPARRISAAINRVEAKNVSRYVNDYRVAEACRLLKATNQPVTAIMFEAGFQTKSNFNREFRRVTGVNPLTWRAKNAGERGSG